MLSIKNLQIAVDGNQILKGINLEVKEGEVHVIMGPNGSGKSTLAYSLAGHPKYQISNLQSTTSKAINEAKICMNGKVMDEMTPDERAREGLFLANQYPVAIPGLTVNRFLWQVYKKRNKSPVFPAKTGTKPTTIIEFRNWLEGQAKILDLNAELLKRGLNDGFSGGEKKKLEILQMMVFNPKFIILDEIDSGLDVDALKKIAQTVAKVSRDRKIGVLVITHYSRILRYLKPDKVHIMEAGKIVKSGGEYLAGEIEKQGYKSDEDTN